MRVCLVLALGLFALPAAPLLAQSPYAKLLTPTPVPEPLPAAQPACAALVTLDSLEQLALANNPTIAAAEGLVRQEQGLATQVGLYPNPTAGYLRTDADQSGQTQTAGVFLSQEIVTPGKLALAKAAGAADVRRTMRLVDAQRARVVNDVRIRYYEVLGAQEAVLVGQDLETLAARGVELARRLLKGEQGTRPDVLQAEIQLKTVQTAVRDARFRHEAAWRQLAHVVGVPDLPPAPLAGRLDAELPTLDWQEMQQQLLAGSPLLQAQQEEILAHQNQLRLARLQAVPNLTVQLVAQRDSVQKYSSVSTLLAMPVPFFNRNQGNIINAEGMVLQSRKEYERIRLALLDQLALSFRTFLSLRAQTETLQQEILPRAKENLDVTTKAYEAGQLDSLRVLAARQVYFQNSLAYIDTLTELHKLAIEIRGLQLTGGLNPTEVGTALQAQGMANAGMRGVLLQQIQEQRSNATRTLPGAVQGGER